jgi:hypothetical protein
MRLVSDVITRESKHSMLQNNTNNYTEFYRGGGGGGGGVRPYGGMPFGKCCVFERLAYQSGTIATFNWLL